MTAQYDRVGVARLPTPSTRDARVGEHAAADLGVAFASLLRPLLTEIVRDAVVDALADHGVAEPPVPELITTDELARALKVCSKTIGRLRNEGLPTLFIGDSPRFRLDDVLEWVAARSREGSAR